MDLICRTCLTPHAGDKLGDKCRTPGCPGVVEAIQPQRSLGCKTCCGHRSGTKAGDPCGATSGCPGIVEELPFFHELVDALPEPMTCGRRVEDGMDREDSPFRHVKPGKGLDFWQKFKTNGDRVCSYCGSLHPEDFFAFVKQSGEAGPDAPRNAQPEIEPSTKGYKIYVHRQGVRNAHEGGIKFYTHHLPHDENGKIKVDPALNEAFKLAVAASNARFRRMLQQRRGEG